MSFRGQNEKYCLKTDTTGENKAVLEPRRREDSQSEGTIWERKLVKIETCQESIETCQECLRRHAWRHNNLQNEAATETVK